MITPKIKSLFQFIEYLNSNIENFNQHNDLIKELEQLHNERNQLKPQNNYRDKQQFDKAKVELESKFKTLQDNTANLIKAKARNLNLCNFDNEPNYSFNGVETEIRLLKDNFCNDDLPEIFKRKSQYLEYRSQTHSTFLSLQYFFNDLDETTKSLFDYFKDTQQNEYELFEAKTVLVNSFEDAAKELKKGSEQRIELLESIIENKILQPQSTPDYNTSQFNEYTYNLFCHIIDEYEKNGIVKFINIWFFLKKDISNKQDILFNFTQDKYKEFIKEKYKIEIKKFQKAACKYEEDEVPILQNISKTYRDNLK